MTELREQLASALSLESSTSPSAFLAVPPGKASIIVTSNGGVGISVALMHVVIAEGEEQRVDFRPDESTAFLFPEVSFLPQAK